MSTEPGPDSNTAVLDSGEGAQVTANADHALKVAVSSPALNEHSFASSDYSAVLYSPSYESPQYTPRRSSLLPQNADDQGKNTRAQSVLLSLIAPPSAAGHSASRRPVSPHFGSVQFRKVQLQEGKSKLQDGKSKKKKEDAERVVSDGSFTAWQEEDKVVDILLAQSPPPAVRTPANAEGSEKGKETPLSQSRQRSPIPSRPSSRDHSRPSSRGLSSRPSSSDLLSRPSSRHSRGTRKSLPSLEPSAVQQRAKTPDRQSHRLKTAHVDLVRKQKGLKAPKPVQSRGSALFSRLQDSFKDMDRPFSRMLQELSTEGTVSRPPSAEFKIALSVLGETSKSFFQMSLSKSSDFSTTVVQKHLPTVTSSHSPDAYFLRRENSSHHIVDRTNLSGKPLPTLDGMTGSTELLRNNLTWPSSSLSLKLHAEERRRRQAGGAHAGIHAAMLRSEQSEDGVGGYFDAAGMPQHTPGTLPLVTEDQEREQDSDVLYILDDDNLPDMLQNSNGGEQEDEAEEERAVHSSPFFDLRFKIDDGSDSPALPSWVRARAGKKAQKSSSRNPILRLSSGGPGGAQQPELITRSLSPKNSSRSLLNSSVNSSNSQTASRGPESGSQSRYQAEDRVGSHVLGTEPPSRVTLGVDIGVNVNKPSSAHSSMRSSHFNLNSTGSAGPARPATVAGTRDASTVSGMDQAIPSHGVVRYQTSTESSRRHSLQHRDRHCVLGDPRLLEPEGRARHHTDRVVPPVRIDGGEIPEWFLRQLAGVETQEDNFLPVTRPVSVCLPQRRKEVIGLQRGLHAQRSWERFGLVLDEEVAQRRERRRTELRTPPSGKAPSPGWSRRIAADITLAPETLNLVDSPTLSLGPGSPLSPIAARAKQSGPRSPALSLGRAGDDDGGEKNGRKGALAGDEGEGRHDSKLHARTIVDASFLLDAAKLA